PSRRSTRGRVRRVSPFSTRRSAAAASPPTRERRSRSSAARPTWSCAREVYRCFCSDYAHLGEVGHGQVGKTMNNLLVWINAVGLIEAGRLAESTGIDLVKLRAALLTSSGASDALKEWDMISFTWALKDMQIVADLTDKAGLSLPIT